MSGNATLPRVVRRPLRVVGLQGLSGILHVGLLVISLISWGPGQVAAQDKDEQRLAAHLAAGEFGPALNIAQSSNDSARRDALLQRVAEAQFRGGARHASLSTASSIQNDRTRSSAFDSLGTFPTAGGRGGAAMADFDTLIELIKTTVAPDSWDDAGGTGAAEPFATGVYVDTSGTMRRVAAGSSEASLASLRRSALVMSGNRDVRKSSPLRKVSLTRLERQAQRLWAMGQKPEEAMSVLAGITRIKYLLVFPDSCDIVVVGPAGDWDTDIEGRLVSRESRAPVMRLDDLVVVLRNAFAEGGRFGCSINPRQENLASVQQFLQESAGRANSSSEQAEWRTELRKRLGPQDIVVHGIDPRTRAARILVEADYHMKLIGMGLEPGTVGVVSYLDSLRIPPGGSPPPMDVLRWWFTLNFEPTRTTEARDAFELAGGGAKVLSENELLAERGERVHTGDSTNLNRQFALSFTTHFAALAVKYPVYAEMRNVFELAMVAALIREEDLGGRCDWHQTHFGVQGKYDVPLGPAPKLVDSIINHRRIDRRFVVTGVSGGVSVDTSALSKSSAIQVDTYGRLGAERTGSVPPELAKVAWWWD